MLSDVELRDLVHEHFKPGQHYTPDQLVRFAQHICRCERLKAVQDLRETAVLLQESAPEDGAALQKAADLLVRFFGTNVTEEF